MAYTPFKENTEINIDASGRARTSNMSTLFDGKSLSADETLLWENIGTGTGSYANNIYNMSVTSGQYQIRRGRHVTPYFSGKSHLLEITFDTFTPQANTTKRVGYFSSNNVAPYDSNYDGFWLESDGTNGVSIEIRNAGSLTASIPLANWDNASKFAGYNFDNFTVCVWDFLWLGGTELRLWIKTNEGFVLAHTYKHASNTTGLFIKSPNQSVRYEIRSSTGTGAMNSMCAHVSTEGGFPEAGKPKVAYNPSAVTTNTVGTIYALKSIKKTEAFRDISVAITGGSISNTTTSDIGIGFLILNPTLSAPLTYVATSRIEEGSPANPASAPTITAGTGRILASIPSGTSGTISNTNDSILANIGMSIENVSSEIVLAYMPTTNNQSVFGTMTFKEY